MFFSKGLTIFWLSLIQSCVGGTRTAPPVLNLGYTAVQGSRNAQIGVDSFLGVRYAVAPSGDLRWRAPVPIELNITSSSQKVFNATVQGPQCVQGLPAWYASSIAGKANSTTSPPSSEDCLSIDLFTPSAAKSKDLPVLVFIHGGGYTLGGSASTAGPTFIEYSNGSIVFVAIQYRLGAYGFLSSNAIVEDGTSNAALLDQRAAISWVYRHISAFGGDPNKVTIWGASAGGGSVTNQLILYGGEDNPPFRAAISEYPWWQAYKTKATLDSQYSDLLKASKCSSLACLRGLPFEELANATLNTYQTGYEAGNYAFGDFYYGPTVDGDIIRDYPQKEFGAGHFSKVALLTDHSTFEGAVFTNMSTTTWNETLDNLKILWPSATSAFFARLEQLYPLSAFDAVYFNDRFFSSPTIKYLSQTLNHSVESNLEYWRAQQIYGDFIIKCPTYYQAVALSELDRPLPVFKLIFNTGTEVHGATVPFLTTPPHENENPELARKMLDYWISFTATLDPSASSYPNTGRPEWPRYSVSNQKFSVLEVNGTEIGVRPDSDASERCDFLYGRSREVLN